MRVIVNKLLNSNPVTPQSTNVGSEAQGSEVAELRFRSLLRQKPWRLDENTAGTWLKEHTVY